MGNILSCCRKPSASPNASPYASPSPGWHSVSVNQVIDESDVYDPRTRNSVAVPPAIAFLDFEELDDLDFEVEQPVLRMSDLKMPAEMDLELIPSDHPRASTIFLKKSQKDVRGKNMKNNSYHVSPGLLRGKHSSCSTIFLDESTMFQPNVRVTVYCLVLAIYYHIKNRDANRSKDIFEEYLHPYTEETDPNEYFHPSPDPESIYNFIRPLFNAFHLTGEFAITTLVYLERLVIYAEIDIGPTNWKRVVLGAILLASKYLSDLAIWNVFFCRVIKDITLKDLNELERQYIYLLQFNLYVSTSVYAKYYFDLRTLAGDHGMPIEFDPLRKERAQKLEVYLERLVIYAEIDIGPTNWKRVVLGAILLASKYLYDLAIWNVYFCRVIKGITLKDLNELERQYIYLLQFNLYVSASVYAKYYFDLRTLAGDHGLPIAFAPLRKERAQKLEAISRYCENPNLCKVAMKKFSSCDNFTDPQIANAILS